jgi:hypothetical protein
MDIKTEDLDIFKEDNSKNKEERIKNAIDLFKKSAYGMQVVAAQMRQELKKRMVAESTDEI